jgi:hypothetical protein
MHFAVFLADYPTGTLTGIYAGAFTIGAALVCLFIASGMRMADSPRAARRWLIAAGVCVVLCVVSFIVARILGLP